MDEATRAEIKKVIEDERKAYEAKGKRRGPVYISLQERVPYKPEYKNMSKTAVIEAERKRKETDLRLREMKLQIEQENKDKPAPVVEAKPEIAKPIEAKPKGKPGRRPKKIE